MVADEARLLRTRNVLLGKLISNWQKQTLGRAVGGWLCSLEALRMDRILLDSDKYLSMDSSIDDLLNDALSKRRARSMLTSSSITVWVVMIRVRVLVSSHSAVSSADAHAQTHTQTM